MSDQTRAFLLFLPYVLPFSEFIRKPPYVCAHYPKALTFQWVDGRFGTENFKQLNQFFMQDQISATELAVNAWKKLKEVSPENELLKWMESDKISDEEFTNHFWDKEEPWKGKHGSMVSMRVETNYFLAVKKELKEKHNVEI